MKKSNGGGKAASAGKTLMQGKKEFLAKKTVRTGTPVNKNEKTRAYKGKGVGNVAMETGGTTVKRTSTTLSKGKPMGKNDRDMAYAKSKKKY